MQIKNPAIPITKFTKIAITKVRMPTLISRLVRDSEEINISSHNPTASSKIKEIYTDY